MNSLILTQDNQIFIKVINKDFKIKELIKEVEEIQINLDKNYFLSLV
ncbi:MULTISPECIES: hypothetical protein [Caloramator]|uniref:Uncharacterized protein n=1 Tax=Caloramator proteoclasticus DSM 10124 TaxID=1121262 RepID=A0A1M5CDC3_9CLOT|nr:MULTISPECIES: hypothetical protein [Caloramator]SHF52597.1 hypothetical protein SAMN02746091_02701 [Caloramator proteoclasticus DSM 10124]